MIRLLIVITFCFYGCANTVTYYPQCNFPDSILKQGGLLKKNFDLKENKKIIFVKNISCFEGKIKKLVSPIPFFLKREIYEKEGINIQKGNFRESRIKIIDNKFNKISKENLSKIKEESEILKSKLLSNFETSIINFPLHHPSAGVISSEFGVKRYINNIPRNPHLGLDIAAPIGTPIYAAESGLIVLARDFFYRGKNILIDHGFSLKTSYSHLNRMVVQEGDMVKRGEIIGYMGESGRVTGSHLHFEVIFIGEKLNPVFFLSKD